MHLFKRLPIYLLLFFLAILVGCRDERPDGMPKLHPVTLHLTQEGNPCEGASIRLIPDEPSNWPAGGATDANGTAILKTYGKFPGVPEGSYKIVVSKIERVKVGPPPKNMYDSQQEQSYHTVDPAFNDPQETTLRLTVEPGKSHSETIELGPVVHERVKRPGE